MFEVWLSKPRGKLLELSLEKISPNPNQPRRVFDEEELLALSQSIVRYGVIQPISVRKTGNTYELIAGERRLRASKMAGKSTIPAVLIEADNQESSEMALIENLQRKDLNFFEEADAILRLMNIFDLSQAQMAEKLSKKQSTIANKLRLLKLTSEEREMIIKNGLTERHARTLLKIEDLDLRRHAITSIILRSLNVANTEKYIESLLEREEEAPRRVMLIKDIRIFLNTINHALEVMQKAGIEARSKKEEKNGFIEYVIKIPTNR